jgi:ABC-type glycerol-3-phosphate transport system permease component
MFLNKTTILTISVGVARLAETAGEGPVTQHLLATGSVLAMLPSIAIFIVMQRFIVKIMISGAVKG